MRKKADFSRDFYIISFLTALTVLVWIVTDAYRILTRDEDPTGYENQLVRLNPELSPEVLADLSSRETISPEELEAIPIPQPEVSPPPEETPAPTPTATPSATTEEATPAATTEEGSQ